MKTRIALSLAVLLGVAGLQGCGGGEDQPSCDVAPMTITQGTWCITTTGTTNAACGGAAVGTSFWVTMTQNGSALTMTSQYGITYTGVVCGDTATVTANRPPADVVTTIVFSDASTGSGSAQWNTGTCSGTDTFTAVAGSCI